MADDESEIAAIEEYVSGAGRVILVVDQHHCDAPRGDLPVDYENLGGLVHRDRFRGF